MFHKYNSTLLKSSLHISFMYICEIIFFMLFFLFFLSRRSVLCSFLAIAIFFQIFSRFSSCCATLWCFNFGFFGMKTKCGYVLSFFAQCRFFFSSAFFLNRWNERNFCVCALCFFLILIGSAIWIVESNRVKVSKERSFRILIFFDFHTSTNFTKNDKDFLRFYVRFSFALSLVSLSL